MAILSASCCLVKAQVIDFLPASGVSSDSGSVSSSSNTVVVTPASTASVVGSGYVCTNGQCYYNSQPANTNSGYNYYNNGYPNYNYDSYQTYPNYNGYTYNNNYLYNNYPYNNYPYNNYPYNNNNNNGYLYNRLICSGGSCYYSSNGNYNNGYNSYNGGSLQWV
ncbi:hypothetical protein BV898_14594 [Hypsibius exemplaris]|uniref:Uncharacterized protein n=1 Tax=Hypsibius exemplaris TaxID=2072580 RepID=A0A9X6NG58_HYPEX|nr:hypothetical protein BV898_14594 [Hypsibius exemplaris]